MANGAYYANTWDDSSLWWYCKCSFWNWSAKAKCQQCGIKKSYRKTAAPVVGNDQGCNDEFWKNSGGASQLAAEAPSAVAAPLVPQSNAQILAHQNAVKELESALAALPSGGCHDATRHVLKNQVDEHKRQITRSKPLTSQISSCTAALERAKTRKSKAEVAIEKAKAELAVADAAVTELQAESLRLERDLADTHEAKPSSVQAMAAALEAVIKDMTSSKFVPLEVAQRAEDMMTTLYKDVCEVVASAEAASVATARSADCAPCQDGNRAPGDGGNASGSTDGMLGATIRKSPSAPSLPSPSKPPAKAARSEYTEHQVCA